jgi:predicted TIM-barrel fold metal-dependent hydrolase
MRRIDAHIHLNCGHPDCIDTLTRLNVKLVNICVANNSAWRSQADAFRGLAEADPVHFAWCTTFDPPDLDDPGYADRVIEQLHRDFEDGAVACKIWKNVGMEIRRSSGTFVMPDDPLLDPIYESLAAMGKPLVAHIGEPLACWQPLSPGTPHYSYYSQHPEWYMANRPGFPKHSDLMAARDRVLERHPELRVIGAHLASLEFDVGEIARRLDRYPNLAVDTSARLTDLSFQSSEAVKQFFMKYQDRILFGTDMVWYQPTSQAPDVERGARLQRLEEMHRQASTYYETGTDFNVADRRVRGLALPDVVVSKLYRDNALAWIPDLRSG